MAIDEHSTERLAQLIAAYRTLGYAGLLPFLAGALGVLLLGDPGARQLAERALIGYGAVILSFLGAVHWGLMLGRPVPRQHGILIAGVLPSLVGWMTLLLSHDHALAVQIAAFGAFWLYEHRVLGTEVLPANYLSTRRVLTLVACAALAIALIGGA